MMMAFVGSDCVTYSVLSSGESATPFGRCSSFSMTVTLPSLPMRYTPLNAISILRRVVELLEAVRRIGEEQHAVLHARHVVGARELLALEGHRHRRLLLRLADSASGCRDCRCRRAGCCFLSRMARPLAPASRQIVRVGVRRAGRIEEFLEAAFLRPLPHLVAGHVGEQQIAAGLHPDRAFGPAEAFARASRSSSPSARWRPSPDPSDRWWLLRSSWRFGAAGAAHARQDAHGQQHQGRDRQETHAIPLRQLLLKR